MEPFKDFKISNGHIRGYVNGLDELKQSILLSLQIPRLQHEIFSDTYGHEFNDLIGKDKAYVLGRIRKNAEECILVDERVLSVDVKDIVVSVGQVIISCTVNTVLGDIDIQKEVNVYGV